MRSLVARAALTGLLTAVAACGDDPFSPTPESVAGSYSATEFTATSDALGTFDLLAVGAEVTVTLAADGTTTGRLFVPGGAEDGSDLDADLAGTWALDGSTVTFNQTADTFIRDAQFTASRNRLTGEGVFQGLTIRLVLDRG